MKKFKKATRRENFLKLPIEDRLAITSLERFNEPYQNSYLFD